MCDFESTILSPLKKAKNFKISQRIKQDMELQLREFQEYINHNLS